MTGSARASVHASAVKVGDRAVLIRGPSGAGKSRLAFDLILAGRYRTASPGVFWSAMTVSGWTQVQDNCGFVRSRNWPA